MDISSEMILNTLPLFLTSIGTRVGTISLIKGVAESISSLAQLFSGRLSDKLGRRKPLAVLRYGLSTITRLFLFSSATALLSATLLYFWGKKC